MVLMVLIDGGALSLYFTTDLRLLLSFLESPHDLKLRLEPKVILGALFFEILF